MTGEILATPFGRRTLSLAMRAGNAAGHSCPPDAVADRWRLMKALVEARTRFGLATNALFVLEALLSCLPDTVMTAGADLVVYPSNDQLSRRSKGMDARSIRRHVAALVDAGLVVRKDSPNGKRFAVRGRGGDVVEAFGFDLSPLLARAKEIEELAEQVAAEERRKDSLRRQVMILRRYVRQAIALSYEQELEGDWISIEDAFRPLAQALPRVVAAKALDDLRLGLLELSRSVDNLLDARKIQEKESANAGAADLHYLDSNTESPIEFEPASEKAGGEVSPSPTVVAVPGRLLPLGLVLKACPDIVDYAPQGISSWTDLKNTAAMVRGFLGVSPSAWEEARRVLGDVDASITIAGLLQRSDEIRSAGGYLRQLTAKAANGGYSTGPMVMSLLKRRQMAA